MPTRCIHPCRFVVLAAVAFAAAAAPAAAADLAILTRGKMLQLIADGDPAHARGVVRFGADPVLADAPDPSCPAASSFELGLFTVSANAVVRGEKAQLDCARWRRTASGWTYANADPEAPGGVRSIVYGPSGLVVKLAGAQAMPAAGPLGYAFAWFEVGARRYHGRFHLFRQNSATRIVSRTTSRGAAEAERGFWTVLIGDDDSEARQQATLAALTAAARSPRDGRSPFLLAMLRLYRFGTLTESIAAASPTAVSELGAAVAAFDAAEPLLWNRATRSGDSRVPGFAAAARYSLAVASGDEPMRQRALADLDYAIEINAFFNVFDLMTVIQAEPPSSAAFQAAFATVSAYLADPTTFQCAFTQPEVCTGAGLGPGSFPGTFVVFGDLFAKAGDATAAKRWYEAARTTEGGWAFEGLGAERLATADARVAAYGDADPSNDPPIIGAGRQACASCHHRVTPPA